MRLQWHIPWCTVSSSSWGCELKCTLWPLLQCPHGHPLREDVSWNFLSVVLPIFAASHPLREDVSWNNPRNKCEHRSCTGHPLREDVSWNDIFSQWRRRFSWSSSSWGCELKYGKELSEVWSNAVILFVRMWVEIVALPLFRGENSVILFVRMWVEISVHQSPVCNLHPVILFVRMWVEMSALSSVPASPCHPLREDVSWNNTRLRY